MTNKEQNLIYNAYALIANNTSGLSELQKGYFDLAKEDEVDPDVLELSKAIYILLKSFKVLDDGIYQLKQEGKLPFLKEV